MEMGSPGTDSLIPPRCARLWAFLQASPQNFALFVFASNGLPHHAHILSTEPPPTLAMVLPRSPVP